MPRKISTSAQDDIEESQEILLDSNNSRLREEEEESLLSIFGDQCIINKNLVESVLIDTTVIDQNSSSVVHLRFALPGSYPQKIPDIQITDSEGLRRGDTQRLLEHLKRRAGQLCGSVMIYDLIMEVGDFFAGLQEQTQSMFEQMMNEKKKLAEESERKKQEELSRIQEDRYKRMVWCDIICVLLMQNVIDY